MIKDPNKIKTTWLLPRDLVKEAKQYALDKDTIVTAVIIHALTDFLPNTVRNDNEIRV
jgi:hypothetical protein